MRFLKYLGRLIGEFFSFAMQNKAWWIVPLVLVMLLIAALVVSGGAIAPFIYNIF